MWESALIIVQEAAPGTPGAPQGPPFTTTLMFMFLIVGIMWFLLIRPNQKRDKKRREMLEALSKGDNVVTMGGICGTIVGLNEKSVVVKVSDDPVLKMEFVRSSISQVDVEEEEEEESKSKKK